MFKALSARFRRKRSRKTEKALDQIVLEQETEINPRPQQSPKREKALNGVVIQQEATINPGKFVGPVEKPRTANKAFGGISDFMLFFENRNPEMKKFAKEFREIEKMDTEPSIEALNKVLAPKIDQCITEMYKKTGTKLKNKYVGLFTMTFETWEQFYKKILYAYTIAGFLYYKMNEFLRNEDWEKLDDLLPYTYSLFKAFLWESKAVEFSKTFEFLKSVSNENKLILYRGADFDDDSLRFYNTSEIKYFSWNGVTSTSLDISVARGFQNGSSNKTPVLMTVEIDFENLNPQDLNALHLEGVSQHPKEKEVALPPGSIFELLSRSEKKSEVEIKLKLVTDPKILARQGQFMHGMLQAVMGEEDELKVVCLRDKELSRAIQHFKGNQLISKLEFSLCSFNEKSAKVFQAVLPTMKNLESFTFDSIEFEEEFCFDQIIECFRILKITKLELANSISNRSEFQSFIGQIQHFGFLKSLKLSFPQDYWRGDHLMGELNFQVSRYLDPQCVFELKIDNDSDIIAKGLNINNFLDRIGKKLRRKLLLRVPYHLQKENVLNLVETERKLRFNFVGNNSERSPKATLKEALKCEVKPLKTLSLGFEGCQYINDEDLKNLFCKEILHFHLLTTLNLDFRGCNAITDETLKNLSVDVIWQLSLLDSLSLCFDNCMIITEEGLKTLICDGIQYIQFLPILRLSFNGCLFITNKGLEYFSNLGKIKSLYLSFERCLTITCQGFENFLSLQTLQFLTNLDLNLSYCPLITDKTLTILSHTVFQNLKESFDSLSLKFDGCTEITEKGLEILVCEGINHLESLQKLSLSFDCYLQKSQISEKGLSPLVSYLNRTSLKGLNLQFNSYEKLTSTFLRTLSFSPRLITLHLSFNNCPQISPAVFRGLSLCHLTLLEHLYLSFRNSETMTDKDFELLCIQEIKYLKKLKILHIDFLKNHIAKGIIDESLKVLGSHTLQHLPELRTLYLDFCGHSPIMHKGLRDLCADFKNLTDLYLGFSEVTDQDLEALSFPAISLETLSLTFHCSHLLSNEGLKKFWRQRIRPLKKLKNLSLEFKLHKQITYEGLKDMCQKGIRYLTSLVTFNLNFSCCGRIWKNEIFLLQSHFDLLNLPELQLPVQILYKETELKISSRGSRPPDFVLCQFGRQLTSNKENKEQNKAESLTLKFEKERFLPYLDIPQIICTLKTLKYLKNLHLTFDGCAQMTDFTLHELCSQGIQRLEFLNSLYLSFAECNQIIKTGLQILVSRGIKHVKLLESLSLNFDGCGITGKEIKHLCDRGIRPLKSLKILNLSFKSCYAISNKSIKRLYHKGMKSLTSFFIDFSEVKITERLKRQLSQSPSFSSVIICKDKLDSKISAYRLKRHNIDKQKGLNISEKNSGEIVMNKLFLRYMERKHYELRTRSEEFESHKIKAAENRLKISKRDIIPLLLRFPNNEFTKLNNQELIYWHSLASLHLVLNEWSNYVTDSALNTLCTEIFPHLKTLAVLNLNCSYCNQITDVGLRSLTDQGIKHLKSSLTSLYLDFTECGKITDLGLQSLCQNGIKHLDSLTDLSLCFSKYGGISYIDLSSLMNQINQFDPLLSKTPLLKFDQPLFQKLQNQKIMETVIGKSENIWHLSVSQKDGAENSKKFEAVSILIDYFQNIGNALTSISLPKYSNGGFHQYIDPPYPLGDQTEFPGLRKFPGYQECHFDFEILSKITEDDFENLCSEGIQNLVEFTKLEIKIHDFGHDMRTRDSFYEWTCNLRQLKTLDLNLGEYTSEGFGFLDINRFRNLEQLEALILNFNGSSGVTNSDLADFCNYRIQDFKKLKKLHINFDGCNALTDEALKSILKGILKLSLIENLELSFLNCPKIQPSSYQNFLKILSYFGFMETDQTFKYSKSLKDKEGNN